MNLVPVNGSYFLSGLHQFGSATNAVEFTDSNKTLFWRDHPAVTAPFNTLDIQNASSIINLTAISWKALGTKTPGTLTMSDDATVNIASCNFIDWGVFTFLTNATVLTTTFLGCAQIVVGGSTFTGCAFDNGSDTVLASTPANAALITNSVFTSDGTGNGLEITGTAANITLSGLDFNGYSLTTDADKGIFVNIATASTTIIISGGSEITAASHVRTAGCVVTVSADVSITFDQMKDDTEVRVYETGTNIEIDGIEDVTAGTTNNRSFTWASPASTVVDYVIHHFSGTAPFYKTIRKNGYVVPATNTTININQLINRNAT